MIGTFLSYVVENTLAAYKILCWLKPEDLKFFNLCEKGQIKKLNVQNCELENIMCHGTQKFPNSN